MSTDVATEVATQATEDKPKRTRKSKGPRARYRFGRSVYLTEYKIPDDGLTEVPDGYDVFAHADLRHTDFRDPLHYQQFLRDVYVPQILLSAEESIASLEKLDPEARADVLAVGGNFKTLGRDVSAIIEGNPDSPEVLAEMEDMARKLLEQLAASRAKLDGS